MQRSFSHGAKEAEPIMVQREQSTGPTTENLPARVGPLGTGVSLVTGAVAGVVMGGYLWGIYQSLMDRLLTAVPAAIGVGVGVLGVTYGIIFGAKRLSANDGDDGVDPHVVRKLMKTRFERMEEALSKLSCPDSAHRGPDGVIQMRGRARWMFGGHGAGRYVELLHVHEGSDTVLEFKVCARDRDPSEVQWVSPIH